jgi:hypothetical protein
MKICTRCQEQKDISDFRADTRYNDGRFPYCRECKQKANRDSYAKHATDAKATVEKWRNQNRDKVRAINRASAKKNRASNRKKEHIRLQTDVQYRLAKTLRSRLGKLIKGQCKTASAVRDLGCSIPELILYIESKFNPGMTWDNWSFTGWHIDHIMPLCSFDLTDREQLLRAIHYTNLQPLWALENLAKNGRYPN